MELAYIMIRKIYHKEPPYHNRLIKNNNTMTGLPSNSLFR